MLPGKAAQIVRDRGVSGVGRILDIKENACEDGLTGTRNSLVVNPRSRKKVGEARLSGVASRFAKSLPRNNMSKNPLGSPGGVRQLVTVTYKTDALTLQCSLTL